MRFCLLFGITYMEWSISYLQKCTYILFWDSFNLRFFRSLFSCINLDPRTNSVLKISSISRNRNGFWLDTTGMVWRQTELPKDQIADYAPVCTSPTIHRDEDRNRYGI